MYILCAFKSKLAHTPCTLKLKFAHTLCANKACLFINGFDPSAVLPTSLMSFFDRKTEQVVFAVESGEGFLPIETQSPW